MAGNGLQLGEVAEIEAQMYKICTMFNRIPNVQFSTEPAILPNCCWWQCFFRHFYNTKKQTSLSTHLLFYTDYYLFFYG